MLVIALEASPDKENSIRKSAPGVPARLDKMQTASLVRTPVAARPAAFASGRLRRNVTVAMATDRQAEASLVGGRVA